MSSQQKIDANRANSRKSTGPRTDEGKAVSRNNAFKHGMRSRAIVAPDEDKDQYAQLLHQISQDFQPETDREHFLVKQMAEARWRLGRLKSIETALFSAPDIDSAEMDRNSRWQVRMENSFYKAYKGQLYTCRT